MWPFPVFASAALTLLVERFAGYPQPLHDRVGHPIEWIGQLISFLDRALNRPERPGAENRLRGVLALALLLLAAFIPAWLVAKLLSYFGIGWIIEALIATAFIAQSSLRQHVRAVRRALDSSLVEARRAVAKIVGRDVASLNESDISRATLESLAENTSDGVVAPTIWYALLGLPGLVTYKAINTADSMIGHKSERYIDFGWAAARLDDVINLPCSRLTGLLFAGAAGLFDTARAKAVFTTMRKYAPAHLSPNAGWPEAALAAALDIRLGGPRAYAGRTVDLAWMGEGRATLNRRDIRAGLKLYGRATTLLLALTLLCAVIF